MKYNYKKFETWKDMGMAAIILNSLTILISPYGPFSHSLIIPKDIYSRFMVFKAVFLVVFLGWGLYIWIDEKVKIRQEVMTFRERSER